MEWKKQETRCEEKLVVVDSRPASTSHLLYYEQNRALGFESNLVCRCLAFLESSFTVFMYSHSELR